MDTDSQYLALAQNELEDCIRPEIKAEWERLLSKDCTNNLTADACASFFNRKCSDLHKKLTKKNLDYSIRISDAQRCFAYETNLNEAMMLLQMNKNLNTNVWKNVSWGREVMDPWKKIAAS